MIVSNHTKLFSIEFLHDYYRDSGNAVRDALLRQEMAHELSITPDETTLQLMKGYRLSYKFDKNKLLCYVQTIASMDSTGGNDMVITLNKPLVNFDENSSLNFRIRLLSSRFLETSNLGRFSAKNKILVFSNDSDNKLASLFSLSKKIPAYKSSEAYQPGMLVTNTNKLLFESIRESDPAQPQNTTKTEFWSPVTPIVQYVSQADLVDDTTHEKCFALISVSLKKNLTNDFSLLKKSIVKEKDNTILGKEYLVHFKKNTAL